MQSPAPVKSAIFWMTWLRILPTSWRHRWRGPRPGSKESCVGRGAQTVASSRGVSLPSRAGGPQAGAWPGSGRRATSRRCTTPDKDTPTQVPLMLYLLDQLGYPDMDGIKSDLTEGFNMIGRIRPRPGWPVCQDGRYQTPTSLNVLRADNRAYLRQKLTAHQVGEHSHALLAELVEEARLGRVHGPCKAPPGWPRRCVPAANFHGFDRLVDPPLGDIFVAASGFGATTS